MCVHLFFLLVELIGDGGVMTGWIFSHVLSSRVFVLDDCSWNDSSYSAKSNRNRLNLVDNFLVDSRNPRLRLAAGIQIGELRNESASER